MKVTLVASDRVLRKFSGAPQALDVDVATVGEAIEAWLAALPEDQRERARYTVSLTGRRLALVLLHNKTVLRWLNRAATRQRPVKEGDILEWMAHF